MILKRLFLAVTMTGIFSFAAMAANQSDPKMMIQELSDEILQQIDEQRAELEANPQKVKVFADEYVLPYVDTPKMARYVMGQYWKKASNTQKSRFTEAFTNSLLRAYSKSILKLKVTKVEVTKMDQTKKGRASVTTEATQADGNKSKVVYRVYQNKKTQKWMLYDVSIEGISMLLNYRKSFASEFDKKGIDQVIADLEAKNQNSSTSEA